MFKPYVFTCRKCGHVSFLNWSESDVQPFAFMSCPQCNHKDIMKHTVKPDLNSEIWDFDRQNTEVL